MKLPIAITDVSLGTEMIRVELVELHNKPMFSAWRHFKNKLGQWQAGDHGLVFSIERLPDVAAAFEDALSRARQERLLP
jgi:hypothetical protein